MGEPNLDAVVEVVREMASRDFGLSLRDDEVAGFLSGILHEPRNLLGAEQLGIVTRDEVATAVADRAYTWLMNRSGRPWDEPVGGDWARLIVELKRALFGTA